MVSNIIASIMAIIALIALIYAIRGFKIARHTFQVAQDTFRQLQHDSIEQTRPYVQAEVVASIAGSPVYDIVIKNTGKSMAKDVLLEIEHWPIKMDDMAQQVAILANTPRDIPPGGHIRAYWGILSDYLNPSATGMPVENKIITRYRSEESDSPVYENSSRVLVMKQGWTPRGRAGYDLPHAVTSHPVFGPLMKQLQVLTEGIYSLRK